MKKPKLYPFLAWALLAISCGGNKSENPTPEPEVSAPVSDFQGTVKPLSFPAAGQWITLKAITPDSNRKDVVFTWSGKVGNHNAVFAPISGHPTWITLKLDSAGQYQFQATATSGKYNKSIIDNIIVARPSFGVGFWGNNMATIQETEARKGSTSIAQDNELPGFGKFNSSPQLLFKNNEAGTYAYFFNNDRLFAGNWYKNWPYDLSNGGRSNKNNQYQLFLDKVKEINKMLGKEGRIDSDWEIPESERGFYQSSPENMTIAVAQRKLFLAAVWVTSDYYVRLDLYYLASNGKLYLDEKGYHYGLSPK